MPTLLADDLDASREDELKKHLESLYGAPSAPVPPTPVVQPPSPTPSVDAENELRQHLNTVMPPQPAMTGPEQAGDVDAQLRDTLTQSWAPPPQPEPGPLERAKSFVQGNILQPVQTAVQGALQQPQAPPQQPPSLPHSEEPASASDNIPRSGTGYGPDLSSRWKTQFDFGATYTGDYRTGTPHRGVDLVPSNGRGIGTEVDAFAPGTVTLIQRDNGAGGLMVYVQDQDGLTHAYMHLAGTAPGLAVGQHVDRGTPIALMGESGTEGSPHLHYEVRKNAAVGDPLNQLIDPRAYLSGSKQPGGADQGPVQTAVRGAQTAVQGAVNRIGQGKDDFINSLAGLANNFSKQTGIDPALYLAIAANETGWGKSQTAQQQNNLFSIQGSGANGSRWAGYPDAAAAFQAFNDLISSAPRYAQAWADRADPVKFIDDLRRAGYVVDEPGYPAQGWVNQVTSIYHDLAGNIPQGTPLGDVVSGARDAVSGAPQAIQKFTAPSGVNVVQSSDQSRPGLFDLPGAALSSAQSSLAPVQRGVTEAVQGIQTPGETERPLGALPLVGGLFPGGGPEQRIDPLLRAFGTGASALGTGVNALNTGLRNISPGNEIARGTMGMEQIVKENRATFDQIDALVKQYADAQDRGDQLEMQRIKDQVDQLQSTLPDARNRDVLLAAADRNPDTAIVEGLTSLATGAIAAPIAAGEAPLAARALATAIDPATGAPSLIGPAARGIGRLGETLGAPSSYAAEGSIKGQVGREGAAAADAARLAEQQAGVTSRMEDLYRQAGEPIPGTEAPTGVPTAAAAREGQPARQPLALGAPEAQPGISAMATAPEPPTMGGGTVGITQSPEFVRQALLRMYAGAFNRQAVKEGGQNFNDASKGIPGATAIVSVDNDAKTVSMLDQGSGMTPTKLEAAFVKLGGSDKELADEAAAAASGKPAGGMGTAIKAIMANSENIWVRSIGRDPATGQMTDSVMHGSGDDFLNGTMHRYYANQGELPPQELFGAPPEIHQVGNGPNGTGTLVWVQARPDAQWSSYGVGDYIENFNRTNRNTDQTVRFFVDGQEIKAGEKMDWRGQPVPIPDEEKPTKFLKTIDVPGATVDIYGSPAVRETGYSNLMLLNNGQYQADLSVRLPGNAKMPQTLVADVHATVGAKEPGYPWTADRNNLIDTTAEALKNYVKDELATDIISRENTRVSDSITKAPMVGPVKLVDDAGIANSAAADNFNAIPGNPDYRKLAGITQDLHEALISELEGREIPTAEGPLTIGPSHLQALAVSKTYGGLNVPASFTTWAGTGDNARGILMNPWAIWREVQRSFADLPESEQIGRYAEGLLGVMLHEISHNTPQGGHEENFAGVLTRIPQFLGTNMRAAIIKSLKTRLGNVWDTLGPQLDDDARQFAYAANESDLLQYGEGAAARRGGGQPGGPGQPGTNLGLGDQGGTAGGTRPGGPAALAAGAAPGTQPGTGLVIRSGGVRAAQATANLQQSLATIKPTRAQVAAATKDWNALPRVGTRVVGLPDEVQTPRDLAALRIHIDRLVQAGAAGRDWYIDSAHKIEEATKGDPAATEKLTQLIAMMATNINPDLNVNFAIEAWNQWKTGTPVNKIHRFDAISDKVAGLLERNEPWEGRKTNSFYVNLKEELDPKMLALKKATVDQWINRAYGYVTKAPSTQQYNFMEDEMRRMAAAQGLRPSQIQAMMWVGQMKLQSPKAKGEEHFGTALDKRMAQIGWETAPGTGEIPGYNEASLERQTAYNRDVGKAFDDNGVNIVARAFGALGGSSFEAPGVWLGDVTPGWQTRIGVAGTPLDTPGGQVVRPASKLMIESVAAAQGFLLSTLPDNKQNAIGWTQIFPANKVGDANAMNVDAGRLLTVDEARQLSNNLAQEMSQFGNAAGEYAPFILTSTERGAWVRNTSTMPHEQFHKAVTNALANVQSDVHFKAARVRADSGLVENDWSTQPNGEGYLAAIQRAGHDEAFRSIQDSFSQRIADAQRAAAERHFGPGAASESATGVATGAQPALPGAELRPSAERAAAGEFTPPETAPPGGATGSSTAGAGDVGFTAPTTLRQEGAIMPEFAATLAGGAAGGAAAYETTDENAPLPEKIGRTALGIGVGALTGRALVGREPARFAKKPPAPPPGSAERADYLMNRGRWADTPLNENPPSAIERLNLVRVAGLLSNTATHLVNLTGNAINGVSSVPVAAMAAGIDWGRASTTGQARQVYFGEIRPMVQAWGPGFINAVPEALRILKEGPRALEDMGKVQNIPRGLESGNRFVDAAIEMPLRLLQASDVLWRSGAESAYRSQLAARQALSEGFRGSSVDQRVSDILQHLDAAAPESALGQIRQQASDMAARSVFQEQRDLPLQRISNPAGQFAMSQVLPFVKTPTNIFAQGAAASPLGLWGVKESIRAGQTAEAETRLARVAIGSALFGVALWAGANGLITGDFPEDQEARNTLPQGWRPWSLRLPVPGGNTIYVPLQNFGPWGWAPAMAAAMTEPARQGKAFTDPKQIANVFAGMGRYALDSTFLQGLSDFVDAIQDPQRAAQKYMESEVASFSPFSAAFRGAMRATGQPLRDPREGTQGLLDAFLATNPATASAVQTRQDILGKTQYPTTSGAASVLSPLRFEREVDNPTIAALRAADVNIPSAPKELNVVGGSMKLTEQETRDIRAQRGALIEQRVNALVNSREYQGYSKEGRANALRAVVNGATRSANSMFLARLRESDVASRREAKKVGEPYYISGVPTP